ncbi:MAG: hypothetical protein ACJ8GN_06280 [Longimicrobiaceae bacterium]
MTEDQTGDPLIDEIRAIRAQISREHGDDPQRLYEHYVEYQKRFKGRLISRTLTPEEEEVFRAGLEELRRYGPEDFDAWVGESELPTSVQPTRHRQDKSAA